MIRASLSVQGYGARSADDASESFAPLLLIVAVIVGLFAYVLYVSTRERLRASRAKRAASLDSGSIIGSTGPTNEWSGLNTSHEYSSGGGGGDGGWSDSGSGSGSGGGGDGGSFGGGGASDSW